MKGGISIWFEIFFIYSSSLIIGISKTLAKIIDKFLTKEKHTSSSELYLMGWGNLLEPLQNLEPSLFKKFKG